MVVGGRDNYERGVYRELALRVGVALAVFVLPVFDVACLCAGSRLSLNVGEHLIGKGLHLNDTPVLGERNAAVIDVWNYQECIESSFFKVIDLAPCQVGFIKFIVFKRERIFRLVDCFQCGSCGLAVFSFNDRICLVIGLSRAEKCNIILHYRVEIEVSQFGDILSACNSIQLVALGESVPREL